MKLEILLLKENRPGLFKLTFLIGHILLQNSNYMQNLSSLFSNITEQVINISPNLANVEKSANVRDYICVTLYRMQKEGRHRQRKMQAKNTRS